jgi:hypothetical protein
MISRRRKCPAAILPVSSLLIVVMMIMMVVIAMVSAAAAQTAIYAWARRIADNASGDRANRAADKGARAGAHGSVDDTAARIGRGSCQSETEDQRCNKSLSGHYSHPLFD